MPARAPAANLLQPAQRIRDGCRRGRRRASRARRRAPRGRARTGRTGRRSRSARYRATRADWSSPQAAAGSTTIAPAPSAAPAAASSRRAARALWAVTGSTQLPKKPPTQEGAQARRGRRRPARRAPRSGRPEGRLVDARPTDRARDGEQRRAGLLARAERTEPVGAEARDQREVRERLDVLHERRRAAEPALERPRRREGRLRVATFERVDERRLLAGDEARTGRPRAATSGRGRAARRERAETTPTSSPAERSTATNDFRAPSAAAASAAPSSTRCGARRSRSLSLKLTGSPSAPLATTTGRRRPAATAASLRPAGKPPPPRPRRPLARHELDQPARRGQRPVDRQVRVEPERQAVPPQAREQARQACVRSDRGACRAHATLQRPAQGPAGGVEVQERASGRARRPGRVLDGGDEALSPRARRSGRSRRSGAARGPKVTLLAVIWTPPSSSGTPRSTTCSRPFAPPAAAARQADRHQAVRARLGGARRCRWSGAWNGAAGSEAPHVRLVEAIVLDRRRRPRAGAPAFRRGEPSPTRAGRRLPRRAIATGAASATTPPATRTAAGPSRASTTRQRTASTTAAAEPSASRPNQPARASLPVPSACTSATGHEA